ncbi:MAG: ankyrin repeat domain-containing protein [Spirochaetales bacterium]|nr:MAG: ankyrin repeat domain-containing protein [Spirochaetales bacterium]
MEFKALGRQLIYAIMETDQDEIKKLIDAGAPLDSPEIYDLTPLQAARYTGDYEILQLLLDMGADINNPASESGDTVLMDAAMDGDLGMVKFLVSRGADINLRNSSGISAAAWAYTEGREDVYDFLMAEGSEDPWLRTPLHVAIENGERDKVWNELENDCDIDARNLYGLTPLMYAVAAGSRDLVKLLLERGANPDLRDIDGSTALMYAKEKGDGEIIALLEGSGT